MNNVFILGAGASREAGAPLMFDFIDKAQEVHWNYQSVLGESRQSFDNVFE
jgi:hypothetical protein